MGEPFLKAEGGMDAGGLQPQQGSLLLLRKFQGKGRHSTETASVVTHAYRPSITQALAAFSHPPPTPTLVLILAKWMESVAGLKPGSGFQGQR